MINILMSMKKEMRKTLGWNPYNKNKNRKRINERNE